MSTLRERPARAIVRAIADAAARWSNADFPPRVRAQAAVEARTGYTTPVVDFALDRLFGSLDAASLEATIRHELGSLEALDGPVALAGRPAAWARGVERVTIVSSDTTVGVAIVPAAFALCAKASVVVKDRSDALVAAFFATLAEEDPAFAGAARAEVWSGGDGAAEAQHLGEADVVVAFGGDTALAAIRARCAPAATFIPFGHAASLAWIAREDRLDPATCDAIARDALLYDGDGCLSVHAIYTERGRDEDADASALAAAFERMSVEFPAGAIPAADAARAAAYRNAAAFRAASGAGIVYRIGGTTTLSAGAPLGDPPPFAPRTVPLAVADDAGELARALDELRLPVQGIAVADPAAPEAVALAERIGAVRLARFGQLQTPPASGHHGGRGRIADYVRWIDLA